MTDKEAEIDKAWRQWIRDKARRAEVKRLLLKHRAEQVMPNRQLAFPSTGGQHSEW